MRYKKSDEKDGKKKVLFIYTFFNDAVSSSEHNARASNFGSERIGKLVAKFVYSIRSQRN